MSSQPPVFPGVRWAARSGRSLRLTISTAWTMSKPRWGSSIQAVAQRPGGCLTIWADSSDLTSHMWYISSSGLGHGAMVRRRKCVLVLAARLEQRAASSEPAPETFPIPTVWGALHDLAAPCRLAGTANQSPSSIAILAIVGLKSPARQRGAICRHRAPQLGPTTLFGPPDSARAPWRRGSGIGVAQLAPVPGGPVRLEPSTAGLGVVCLSFACPCTRLAQRGLCAEVAFASRGRGTAVGACRICVAWGSMGALD